MQINTLHIQNALYEISNETELSIDEVKELKLYHGPDEFVTLEEALAKGTVYGFAEIQIDNAPLGAAEVAIELKRLGLENAHIFLYDCYEVEKLPDDWFEDYVCKYIYVSSSLGVMDVYRKMQEIKPSYILTVDSLKGE